MGFTRYLMINMIGLLATALLNTRDT